MSESRTIICRFERANLRVQLKVSQPTELAGGLLQVHPFEPVVGDERDLSLTWQPPRETAWETEGIYRYQQHEGDISKSRLILRKPASPGEEYEVVDGSLKLPGLTMISVEGLLGVKGLPGDLEAEVSFAGLSLQVFTRSILPKPNNKDETKSRCLLVWDEEQWHWSILPTNRGEEKKKRKLRDYITILTEEITAQSCSILNPIGQGSDLEISEDSNSPRMQPITSASTADAPWWSLNLASSRIVLGGATRTVLGKSGPDGVLADRIPYEHIE